MTLPFNIKQKYIKLKYKLINIDIIGLIKYGYHKNDTWDIYSWFIKCIKPMLIRLREESYGYSCATQAEWREVLDKMIYYLGYMDEDLCDNKLNPTLLDNEGNYYWDSHNREKSRQYQEYCKNEFFKLFQKYFYNLWD